MKYRCPRCKKVFSRDGRLKPYKGKKTILSYCEETDSLMRCRKIIT